MTYRLNRPSFLNIVAHQDDDLLFMNPDIDQSIHMGATNTTVYLTAGEAHFRSSDAAPGQPGGLLACKSGNQDDLGTAFSGIPTREQYVDCRRRGILAAYAAMLGNDLVDDARPLWECRLLDVKGGRLAECFFSILDPAVSLVFLNLPENADSETEGGPQALRRLWCVPGTTVRTIRAAGSVLGDRTFPYDRDALVEALLAIMKRTRPTVVRTLDSQPDSRYRRKWECHDHTDHVMAGLFAACALEAQPPSGEHRPVHVAYRGYNTADVPENVHPSPTEVGKSVAFWAYAAYDVEVNKDNCHEYQTWLRRMYYRWPLGTTWARNGADGEIHAFAVVGNEMRVWWQTSEGDWRTRGLGRPPRQKLAPGVSVCPQLMANCEHSSLVTTPGSRALHTAPGFSRFV